MGTIKYRGTRCRDLISNLVLTNSEFRDQEFQCAYASLGFESTKSDLDIFSACAWVPVQELFQKQAVVLYKHFALGNIQYGYLCMNGLLPCYLAMAVRCDSVASVFNNTKFNVQGLYSLRLHIDGRPQEILVDHYIPCIRYLRYPLFLRLQKPEIWPLLLEKAWAKTYGKYVKS